MQLANSRSGTTQITVSGVEDLGGGLKTRFQISSSFDSTYDNGTSSSRSGGAGTAQTLGNNGMFLALDSSVGSLILGRPMNTLYAHSYTANGTKGVTGFAATNTIDAQGIYTANAVQYVTPNLGGFTAQFEFAPAEVAGNDDTTTLALKYASGPFGVSLAWDRPEASAALATKPRIVQLAGFWDFGVAKLSGTYQDGKNATIGTGLTQQRLDKAWVIGVNVPVGAGQFWAQYGSTKRTAVAFGDSDDANTLGLGYKYNLSKRTIVYANFGRRNDTATIAYAASLISASAPTYNAAVNGTGKTGWGLGLQHNF